MIFYCTENEQKLYYQEIELNEGDENISIYHLIIGIENSEASVMLFMIITVS